MPSKTIPLSTFLSRWIASTIRRTSTPFMLVTSFPLIPLTHPHSQLALCRSRLLPLVWSSSHHRANTNKKSGHMSHFHLRATNRTRHPQRLLPSPGRETVEPMGTGLSDRSRLHQDRSL